MKKKLLSGRLFRGSVFSLLAWVFFALSIVVTLILDYRNWEKGEKSYLFTGPRAEKAGAPSHRKAAEPEKTVREPEAKTRVTAVPPPSAKPALLARAGKVALIIDDMGNSLEALDEIVRLGEPVTVSVMPYGDEARETARIAHEKGLEVLLHLPLESLGNHESESTTRGLILTGMSPEDVRAVLEDDLGRVPFISGVNNHMGSKVTADESLMRQILEPIRERGLFFVDSRTNGKSVAFEVARSMGIPAAHRQVFLDADGDNGMIKERLMELFRLARKDGQALGIGHPYAETLRVLRENFHRLGSFGLRAVFASELVSK